MASAKPLPPGVEPESDWGDWWDYDPAAGDLDTWPGEFKRNDWGIYQGRRVLLDYAAPALYEP